MRIIILGAGEVGSTLTELLVQEKHDVTVVDLRLEPLQALQAQFDIRTVCGSAAYPDVLHHAGARHADMLIAVTDIDEINMIACQVAYTLYRTPKKIARIQSTAYLGYPELFQPQGLPIDVIISPEKSVSEQIRNLIQYPETLQVLPFARGYVLGIAVSIQRHAKAIGCMPAALYQLSHHCFRIALVIRKNLLIVPDKKTTLQEGDQVFLATTPKHSKAVMQYFITTTIPYHQIIIAGGGHIGSRLAMALEHDFHVKIIDHAAAHADHLAQILERTLVLQGDAADTNLLMNEDIQNTDIFCAVTNHEEVNIMSALLAKNLGARKVMALVNRPAYQKLLEGKGIDLIISPKQATISSLLLHLRHGDVISAHALYCGGEALEVIAHGNRASSRIVDRAIGHIKWPAGIQLIAIIRRAHVFFDLSKESIQSEDHLILFITDKANIADLEQLLQVSITFVS